MTMNDQHRSVPTASDPDGAETRLPAAMGWFAKRDAEHWLRDRGVSRRARQAAVALAFRLPGVRWLPQWALRRLALLLTRPRG
jgi:hypothetical protein